MSASRYAAVQDAATSPRDLEIRAFHYVNGLLAGAREGGVPARIAALHKAHRLWSILVADLLGEGNRLPAELKGRIVSLGLWAQRESLARMDDTSSLEPLMALHRDMIEGLEAQSDTLRPPSAPGAFAPAAA